MAKVIIVGGGLAGMVAALRLAERGVEVSLFEGNNRLGGKAGADRNGDDFDEHSYHIFLSWYVNIWKLVDELGIQGNFEDRGDSKQLSPGKFPEFTTLGSYSSIRYAWRNLTSGITPFPHMFLFFYSVIDLTSQTFQHRAFLDQISVNGFLRSRFYTTEKMALHYQDLILKAFSAPSYDFSAMTMCSVLRYWLKNPTPLYRVLRGNLQEFFITPIQRKLEQLGCQIHLSHTLEQLEVQDSRITRLYFRNRLNSTLETREVDTVILAIPPEKLAQIINNDIYSVTPNMSRIQFLRVRPLAALHLYFTESIPNIPKDHINLLDSRFGLSFIDVSQTWPNYDATVLSIMVPDYTLLKSLPADQAVDHILSDLERYLPGLDRTKIRRINFQSHVEEPVFMNDVGSWHHRPEARTELANLYLAGDYCRSHVDVFSMEGAVVTGLLAAEAVRQDVGADKPITIVEAAVHPTWLLFLGKLILSPLAAAAKLVTLFTN